MEFLGLFWFVGVFFTIVVRRFYGRLLEGYEFPKSRFSVQAFRFFAVGFEPLRTIECFFPYGFSRFGIPAERKFPRSVETLCFVASSVAVVCPFSIERSFASQIGSTSLSLPFIQVFAFFFEFFVSAVENLVFPVFALQVRSSGLFLRGFQPYFIEAFFMVTDDHASYPLKTCFKRLPIDSYSPNKSHR